MVVGGLVDCFLSFGKHHLFTFKKCLSHAAVLFDDWCLDDEHLQSACCLYLLMCGEIVIFYINEFLLFW